MKFILTDFYLVPAAGNYEDNLRAVMFVYIFCIVLCNRRTDAV